ncbi:MAG: NADH-quinone oxidoreductase subunit L [Actinomycetota bacterium]
MVAAETIVKGGGFAELAWVVALLPFVSALLTLFFGKRSPGKGSVYGIAALAAGFVLSIGILLHFARSGPTVESSVAWFRVGPLHVEAGQYVDGLTAVMLVVVTTVSLCVHVYSLGYMHGDRRFTWFYVALSLFTGAMLNVVIADNLFQLLVGWEVMGFCSYILIGHWWEEHANSSAAIKAFLVTRTGDIPFLFGIFALVYATGMRSANIVQITEMAAQGHISQGWLTLAALLLFGGTIGKSAQFPLHVWLPDAMAGPTPVSALIHAATMVAAGVYLVGRMFEVLVHADPWVLTFVSTIAAITMLIAALMAMIQDDIKRVLAYSTISQLAYMVAGLSMGEAGYTAGLFHLFTHAFFKALLFLGAGSVIHSVHSNNMSEMGGLKKYMPVTFWTFAIGSAALAGIPPFAGFWSKDEIISTAFHQGKYALWAIAAVTAILTAFYMMRAVLLTFYGEYRGHGSPHESPAVITAPLIALAGLACTVGFLNATAFNIHEFTDWVHIGAVEHEPFNYGFAALSVIGALLGLAAGYRLYSRWREPEPLRRLGPGYVVLENKFYLDTLYWNAIVQPIRDRVSAAVYWTNQHILDGVVNGAAWVARKLGIGVNEFDREVIDGAVNGVGQVAGFTGGLLRYLQSGNVQRYAAFLFAGIVVLTVIFTKS